jgi:hypothetical protein
MQKSNEIQAIINTVRISAQQRVNEVGIMKAVSQLGVSREALCRMLGGLNVQSGTVLAVGHALGLVSVPSAAPSALAITSLPNAA